MIDSLTPREIEVLFFIAQGLPDREVGRALGISPLTVRNHQRAMREKTGLANRTQLALYAIRAGIAPLPQLAVSGELFA
jgi:DNA-binding CsgD family transcriptional regulator